MGPFISKHCLVLFCVVLLLPISSATRPTRTAAQPSVPVPATPTLLARVDDSSPQGSMPASIMVTQTANPNAAIAYFTASTPDAGRELWRTDGMTTEMVTDLFPGPLDGISRSAPLVVLIPRSTSQGALRRPALNFGRPMAEQPEPCW